MTHDPLAVKIYTLLDQFTGGIERFLPQLVSDLYEGPEDTRFFCASAEDRYVGVGEYPPGRHLLFTVALGAGHADLETLIRGRGGDEGTLPPAGSLVTQCVALLTRMCEHQAAGRLHHISRAPVPVA